MAISGNGCSLYQRYPYDSRAGREVLTTGGSFSTGAILTWLLPVTNHFARAQRQVVTLHLLNTTFNLCRRMEEANVASGP